MTRHDPRREIRPSDRGEPRATAPREQPRYAAVDSAKHTLRVRPSFVRLPRADLRPR